MELKKGREWLVLPKGAADYFRDRRLDIAGDATPKGEAASVILTFTLKRDRKGRLDLGPFAESRELRKLFDSVKSESDWKELRVASYRFPTVIWVIGATGRWFIFLVTWFKCTACQGEGDWWRT